jgi:hypothetical protein
MVSRFSGRRGVRLHVEFEDVFVREDVAALDAPAALA